MAKDQKPNLKGKLVREPATVYGQCPHCIKTPGKIGGKPCISCGGTGKRRQRG